MRKLRVYKGFVIATNGDEFFVFDKEEYGYGEGWRTPEFECGNINECLENIDSYDCEMAVAQ